MIESSANARKQVLGRLILLALLLVAAWLLWSGLYKPLLLILGAVSCVLTLWVVKRMGYFDADVFAFRYNIRLMGFWGWLGAEIVRSSIAVARHVLSPTLKVEPRVVRLDVSHLEPVDQALLGNSITLTPGTLSLDVDQGELLVHALDVDGAQGLIDGEMQKRVEDLRGN
ncbi:MAG: Na+/H+ antiporter subunit E [Woeseiaceae bacterium]|nr:Na+/H+ antiporter subunit E [Woeseiaceae bacterium]